MSSKQPEALQMTFTELLNNLHAAYKSGNYRQIQKALKACRDTECVFEPGQYEVWQLLTGTKFTSKKVVLQALCKKVLRKEADRRRGRREYKRPEPEAPKNQPKLWIQFFNQIKNSENPKGEWRKLCRAYHPDTSRDPKAKSKFLEVMTAWDHFKWTQKKVA